MKEKIIIGVCVMFLLTACSQYNHEIEKLNACSESQKDACERWKCLCNIDKDYDYLCERYKDYCVDKICEDIIKIVNGVTFMQDTKSDVTYASCIFVYHKTVLINNITMIDNATLVCLSRYRNNMNISDSFISHYKYINGRIYDGGVIVRCYNV